MGIDHQRERVLVVQRRVLEDLGLFQGIEDEIDRYLSALWTGRGVSFMPRREAERNPAYKQLIPYVIMAHADRYLCYVRGPKVDEDRLAEKASIGIGGHINSAEDGDLSHHSVREVYARAVAREVAEEVIVETSHEDKIIGLINDDSNEVGQVHIGIVHLWQLAGPHVLAREEEICQLQFMRVEELLRIRSKMETWSQLCLDRLAEVASRQQ